MTPEISGQLQPRGQALQVGHGLYHLQWYLGKALTGPSGRLVRMGKISHVQVYPVVRRELRSQGIHIPYIFPIQWGAKELLGVS